MKLFLASEGSDPQTIEKLKNYIGEFDGKRVVYIPTARNGENPFGLWKDSSTWEFLQKSGMEITPYQIEDRKDISPSEILEIFDNKDIVWVSGGACGYLMYWIRRVRLDQLFSKILERSLYVGSSAGSMITASTLHIVDWYIGEDEPGASLIPGLGFVDFDFYPHYQDNLYIKIKKRYDGKKVYLVKNGEVILVEDGKITVVGEERIITND